MFLHKVKKVFFFYSVKRKNADVFLLRGMVDSLRTCPEIDKGGWLAGSEFSDAIFCFSFPFSSPSADVEATAEHSDENYCN